MFFIKNKERYCFYIKMLTFCTTAFTISPSNAQTPTTRTYTQNDGLYQIEILASFMTDDSLLFICEANYQLALFDGYRVTQIPDSCNITHGIIKNLFPLKKGCFIAFERPYYYEEGGFHPLELDHSKFKIGEGYFYSNGRVFSCGSDDKIYVFNENNRRFEFYRNIPDEIVNYEYEKQQHRYYFESYSGDKIVRYGQNYFQKVEDGYKKIDSYEIGKQIPEILHWSLGKDKFKITLGRLTDDFFFPRRIDPLSRHSSRLLTVVNNQIDYYLNELDPENFSIRNSILFRDPKPLNVLSLRNKNFLISSLEGLIRLNNNILFFSKSDPNMISALHTIAEDNEDNVYFGGYGTGWSKWDGEKLSKFKAPISASTVLPGSFTTSNGDILFFSDNLKPNHHFLRKDKIYPWPVFMLNRKTNKLATKDRAGYFIDTLSDGRLAFGLNNVGLGIEVERTENKIIVESISSEKGLNLGNVLHFAEDRNKRIWCGRVTKGVAVYDVEKDTAYTYDLSEDHIHSFGTMSAEMDSWGNLWMGSNRGLKFLKAPYLYDIAQGDLFSDVVHVELPNGDRSIITFMQQVDSFLVLGNHTGVSFVDLNSFYSNPDHPIIYQLLYGEDIQGAGSEQNAILYDSQRRLWIGSEEGVSMIKWDDFEFDHTRNKIALKSIITGGKEMTLNVNNEIILPKDNRNCSIRFGPRRNISLLKNIFFDYYFINQKGDTIDQILYDQQGVFNRYYIPPGKYRLIIEAKKHGQLMDRKVVKFHAPLSLTENTWFWSGLILLLLSGLGFYIIQRSRQQTKHAEQALQLAELRHDKDQLQIHAIISSFNPHFINNSLHWAQSRYYKDPVLVKLIDRLSTNIHYILDNTRKGCACHSLEEEMKLVQNYIDIQQIRFEDSFEYRSPDFRTIEKMGFLEVLLLQIQIHVENAVEHGLRNRIKSNFVQVEIEEDPVYLKIVITDDGCGRKKAKELESKGTQQGLKMLNELYVIFNENNTHPITQEYEDDIFMDEMGKKYGTRVIIQIPKSYRYDIG